MRRHRKTEGFNLAFLDIMSCGLGAVVLVFMLVKYNVAKTSAGPELLENEMIQLELKEQQLKQTLAELINRSKSESENIAQLKAQLASITRELKKKNLNVAAKENRLVSLQENIKKIPRAKKEDPIEDDRGGEENYLIGLKVKGERIAVLIDASASMTDEKLLDIIRRKNLSALEKKKGPKWQRTIQTIRWLLAQVPEKSQVAVIAFNDSVKEITGPGYINIDNTNLTQILNHLDALVPEQATNLDKGLRAAAKRQPTDFYLITDGLPTKGESRYTGLNPFAGCNSLLGRSNTISGKCRVKLFRHTIRQTPLPGAIINVILLPIEGDPDASNEYWAWTALSGGLLLSPAQDWP